MASHGADYHTKKTAVERSPYTLLYVMELIAIHIYIYIYMYILIGGLEHFLLSPIAGMMIQSDFHIFQRG